MDPTPVAFSNGTSLTAHWNGAHDAHATDLLASPLFAAISTAIVGLLSLVLWARKARTISTLPPLVRYKVCSNAFYNTQLLVDLDGQYPVLGSTFDFIKDPSAFTTAAYEKYGSVFRVYFRGYVQVVVGKEYVRDIFLNPAFSYEVGHGNLGVSPAYLINRCSTGSS